MIHKPWFMLPPVQAWYFRKYNPWYKEPPEFAESCKKIPENNSFELIYPRQFTRVFVPRELNGSPGQTVFEVAHRNPEATVYWYVDEEYIGKTNHYHQMGLYPEQGLHVLHLVDDKGREIERSFEVINSSR
jgi:penicillin-binding protein 1C